jgi:hypothetical protein
MRPSPTSEPGAPARRGVHRGRASALRCGSSEDLHDLQACVADVAQALVLLLLQTASQQLEGCGGRFVRQRLPVRLVLQHRRHRVGERLSVESPLAGEQLEEHAAKGPHVAATVHLLAPRLLGAHIRRRPQHRPRLALGRRLRVELRVACDRSNRPGQAEVEQLDAAVGAEADVAGLEVAVQDAFLVGRFERPGDLTCDRQRLARREGSAAQPVREALALDQFHDEDRHAAVGVLETVQGRDAGMVQGSEDAGFLPKPC